LPSRSTWSDHQEIAPRLEQPVDRASAAPPVPRASWSARYRASRPNSPSRGHRALSCFEDDFEACIAHLRLPFTHRRVIRTTNLLERLFVKERRRQIIPNSFGEKPVLKLMFGAVMRRRAKARSAFHRVRTPALRRRPKGTQRRISDLNRPAMYPPGQTSFPANLRLDLHQRWASIVRGVCPLCDNYSPRARSTERNAVRRPPFRRAWERPRWASRECRRHVCGFEAACVTRKLLKSRIPILTKVVAQSDCHSQTARNAQPTYRSGIDGHATRITDRASFFGTAATRNRGWERRSSISLEYNNREREGMEMSWISSILVLSFLVCLSSAKADNTADCNCGNGNVEAEGTCHATVKLINSNKTIHVTSDSAKCSLASYQLGDNPTTTTVKGKTADEANLSNATTVSNITCQICKP
jgi:hypothetical protein